MLTRCLLLMCWLQRLLQGSRGGCEGALSAAGCSSQCCWCQITALQALQHELHTSELPGIPWRQPCCGGCLRCVHNFPNNGWTVTEACRNTTACCYPKATKRPAVRRFSAVGAARASEGKLLAAGVVNVSLRRQISWPRPVLVSNDSGDSLDSRFAFKYLHQTLT